MKIHRSRFGTLAWAVALLAAGACHESVLVVGPAPGTDTDTDADTDTDTDVDADADTDADTDTDSDTEPEWTGVTLDDVYAPDEYTVIVEFAGGPPAAEAGEAALYGLTEGADDLAIEAIEYDAGEQVATLTTAKQKLGVTYTLAVAPPEETPPLTADFLSADTATFWVVDFATYEYEQIVADRRAVGEHGVAYIEQSMWTNADLAMEDFDENVYPVETALFTDTPDMDDNDRIVLLGLDGGEFYGGYFDPINTYTEEQLISWGWYDYGYRSNEMEIIHINVAWGEFDSGGTIVPHEFQHLLYQERHPMNDWLDTYHNEGLAECAVRAVTGDYDQAIGYYFADYSGMIGAGLSLVNWGYAVYENYVLAFMFWSYVAAQLDGVDTYGALFDLDSGAPDVVQEFFLDELGTDFGGTQLDQMLAVWIRGESGAYGYEGFLDLDGMPPPPHVPAGTSSVDLEPYAGAFFPLGEASVDYPGTQGEHIVYAGIDGDGAADYTAPFAVDGGALVTLNTHLFITHDYPPDEYPPEHSGPDLAASGDKATAAAIADGHFSPTWTDPPPAVFLERDRLQRWVEARTRQIDAL
jgi:hypothetical protein